MPQSNPGAFIRHFMESTESSDFPISRNSIHQLSNTTSSSPILFPTKLKPSPFPTMLPVKTSPETESNPPQSPLTPQHPSVQAIQSSSPRFFFSTASAAIPAGGSHRRIAIAVDLSDESAYAVKWAVQNYLRPGDAVILLHVRPTSVLYGADWGSIDLSISDASTGDDPDSQQKLEEDFDAFTTSKAQDIAQPLVEAKIPFKIHIVKDHDMEERLCLEVERLGLSAVIMGSRGVGAARRSGKGRLGSVSDYCVHHCACPVVVVRLPEDAGAAGGGGARAGASTGDMAAAMKGGSPRKEVELKSVPEEEHKDV